MSLDLAKLENVRPRGTGWQSACPACRTTGKDRRGNHLRIFEDEAYHCVVGSDSDPNHNREIRGLAGKKEGGISTKTRPRRESRLKDDWMPDFDPGLRARALDAIGPWTLADLHNSSPWPHPEQEPPGRVLMMLHREIWAPLLWAPEPWLHTVCPIYQVENPEEVECVSANRVIGDGTHCPREDGRPSPSSEANYGPRSYLISEFDSGTSDEQAALIEYLRRGDYFPLRAVVHSGGKSLHAWWDVQGASEKDALDLLRLSVGLGSDPSYRRKSQRTRTPNAKRSNGKNQTLYYLEPAPKA